MFEDNFQTLYEAIFLCCRENLFTGCQQSGDCCTGWNASFYDGICGIAGISRQYIKLFEDRTEFSFASQSSEENINNSGCGLAVGWLPDGYTLFEEKANEFSAQKTYRSDDGKVIRIAMFMSSNMTLGIDTENADVSSIDIQGFDALVITKGDAVEITWADESQQTFIVIDGAEEQTEDLIKIAKNLTANR